MPKYKAICCLEVFPCVIYSLGQRNNFSLMTIIIIRLKTASANINTVMIGAEEGLKKCLGVLRQKGKKIRHREVHISARCKGTRNMVFWIKVLVKELCIAIDLQTVAKSIIQNIQQRGSGGVRRKGTEHL